MEISRTTSNRLIKLNKIYAIFLLLRPKEYVKNFFVFAPLLFAKKFVYPAAMIESTYAFLMFCIAASSVYIINDICDLKYDKIHLNKAKNKPLALGVLTTKLAIICLSLLYMILGFFLYYIPNLATPIISYIVLNFCYSLWLKHEPIIDLFCISTGFILRIYAGCLAINVSLSVWMFVSTICITLFLASSKRYLELKISGKTGRKVLNLYNKSFLNNISLISATSSLFFYSMYVLTERNTLVITIPLVLFGIFRFWYLVDKETNTDSPTNILVQDWLLASTLFVWAIVVAYLMLE